MENRAGKRIRNLDGEAEYFSFLPAPLPPKPDIEIDDEARELLVDAHSSLALLNGLAERIPNMDLFISMYVRKEALVSSQIEGTQCTLEDVLNPELDENANADVSDVVNYVRAINFAEERLNALPLCNRLIREIHAVLMNSVRGGDKTPGEFRVSRNWIGPAGCTLKNALYIPPNPGDMVECMSDSEKYMNADDGTDPLIKAALIHYQFETIHPFLDGNGRLGRLLITLFLMWAKVISSPVLYLSCYLKLNRIEYYDRMGEVRRTGNYEQWVKFFLRGVALTAKDAVETIDRLTALRRRSEAKLADVSSRSRENIMKLCAYIERNPIIETSETAAALGLSRNGTAKYIALLCDKGILRQSAKSGKARVYSYEEYLNILKKDT
ncbi:MAG: Fic family protein [Abditibacteriota bacterium]|nr:Fic family protein [Abditibacteriota bacterium]